MREADPRAEQDLPALKTRFPPAATNNVTRLLPRIPQKIENNKTLFVCLCFVVFDFPVWHRFAVFPTVIHNPCPRYARCLSAQPRVTVRSPAVKNLSGRMPCSFTKTPLPGRVAAGAVRAGNAEPGGRLRRAMLGVPCHNHHAPTPLRTRFAAPSCPSPTRAASPACRSCTCGAPANP